MTAAKPEKWRRAGGAVIKTFLISNQLLIILEVYFINKMFRMYYLTSKTYVMFTLRVRTWKRAYECWVRASRRRGPAYGPWKRRLWVEKSSWLAPAWGPGCGAQTERGAGSRGARREKTSGRSTAWLRQLEDETQPLSSPPAVSNILKHISNGAAILHFSLINLQKRNLRLLERKQIASLYHIWKNPCSIMDSPNDPMAKLPNGCPIGKG